MNIQNQEIQPTVIEGFLLSPPQAQAWRERTTGTMTNAVVWVRLSSPINSEKLCNQIERVILQDLQFSTGFDSLPGMTLPVQVLEALTPSINFSVCDTLADVERETQTEIARLAHLPLGQDETPAVAMSLLIDEHQQEYGVLILATAPFVADEASLLILLDRVASGREIPQVEDEEEPLRFQHFSEWTNEEIRGTGGQGKKQFWSEESQQTASSYIELPCLSGEQQVVATRAILDDWLKCLTNFGSPEAVLLTAWGLIAGQFLPDEAESLTVSRLAAGRVFGDFEEMVGPFAGRAPIDLVRDAATSVAEVIATVDQAIALHEDALIHYSGSNQVNRELSGATVGFAWIAAPVPRAPFHDVNVKPATIGGNLDLIVEPMANGRRIRVVLSGLADRSGLAERLVEAVLAAVKYMAEAPEAPFRSVPLMGMEEYSQVVTAWNNTKQLFELPSSIPAAFRQIAAKQLASLAVVDNRGELTFAELDSWSEHLAHELIARGIEKETPVAVLADRSQESIVSLLAIMKAGGVYVPINPDFPNARIERMLMAANIKIVATERVHIEKAQRFNIDLLIVDAQDWKNKSIERVAVEPNPTNAAYIIFTSGSTGVPNGVIVEHRSALNLWQGLSETIYRGSNRQLRVSVNAPLSFDASIKQILQLLSGHTLYLIPADARVDPKLLLAFLVEHDLNVFDCTPSLLQLLVSAGLNGSFSGLPELILVGGEPFAQELWNLVSSWQRTRVFNLYGPTEATVNTTFAEVSSSEDEPTIGKPLPNVRVYVLDPYGRPKMIGASGELCIAGEGVARGYTTASEQSAQRFAEHSLSDEAGQIYLSGDRVRWRNDGRLTFLGRADRQIKLRGYRIDLGDIDSSLAQHPAVNESVTVLRQEENSDTYLASYVTLDRKVTWLDSPNELDLEIPTGHLIASINRHETMYLYQEIFVDRCYMRDEVVLPPDAIVLDVGANIGMFSLFVALYAPKASIYAFEPLPPIQERLRSNIQRYANGVKIFSEGLSDRDREETFTYYPGYSMMSGQAVYADTAGEVEVIRRYLSNEQQAGAEEKGLLLDNIDAILEEKLRPEEHLCQLRRLADVLKELNLERIDLLKIDVQRAEIDVLRGLDHDDWSKIKQIVLEVHDKKGGATEGHVAELTEMLKSRGFAVKIRQDNLLEGTDRFNCYAVRPGYAETLKNSVSFDEPKAASASLPRVDSDSLRGFLENHLPSYMLPQMIAIVDRLPLTAEGKIDYRSLPAPQTSSSSRDIVLPSNAIEASLVEIWVSILKRPQISVTDNFFQLGGDSIRTIQMQAIARDQGLSFSIQDLFQHQTIRELAAMMATEARAKIPITQSSQENHYVPFELIGDRDRAKLPDGLADAYPMTALQLSMTYLTETSGDPRVFHNVTIHNIAAPLKPDALRQTLAQSVARHPILRTSFALTSFCEPLQLVWKQVNVDVPIEDLSNLDSEQRHARLTEAVEREHNTKFDLSVAPLFRFAAFRLDSSSYALLVAEHHAVIDGWSRHALFTEIGAVYAQTIGKTMGKQFTPLKEVPAVTYRDFALLEKKAARDPNSIVFWVNELRRAPSFHLPNHLEAKEGDRQMAERTVPVPSSALSQLERLSTATTLPIRSLLLAIHLLALTYHTDQDEVVTGFVTSGRPEEPGADEILGLFLNIVPCYVRTRGRSPIDLAGEAFEFERRLLPHRRYPLSEIRRQCGAAASFDSLFNFTHFHSLEEDEADSIICDVLGSVPVDVDMGLAVDFQIDDTSQQLQVSFQYDARRFSVTDADGFLHSYIEAMDDLLVRPYKVSNHQAIAGERDRISSLVAEAFGNALGCSVEAQSGFFSVGGDSLRAVKVVSELRQATGRMIPLSVMAGDPTIEEVAAAITIAPQQVSQITKPRSLANSDRWLVRKCVVDEPRLRLFALAPAGGNASIFDDWKELLPKTIAKSIEIVAIQYPGRQERLKEPAITNMRELVSGVAEAIAPLIDRPFAMLGSSLGALLAFETARLLRSERGVEPSHLFVVCARAPQRKEPYPRFHAMTDAELIETLDSLEGVAPEILENSELLNLLLPIIRADSLVSSSYRYQHDEPFKCPIVVVVGSRDQSVSIEQSDSWRHQTTGSFELKVIEGGHGLITSNKQELIKAISYDLTD